VPDDALASDILTHHDEPFAYLYSEQPDMPCMQRLHQASALPDQGQTRRGDRASRTQASEPRRRYAQRMKRIAVACVVLLLVLAGCSGTPTSQQTTGPVSDANFLGLIGNEGPANLDDAALIRVGHVTCDQIDKGSPKSSMYRIEVKALVIAGPFTEYQANLVVTAAIGAYCPRFTKYLPNI